MSLRRGSEELLPLYRNCVFRSDERADSHWHIAHELADHQLSWRRGAVDVAMFKGELHQIKAYVLRYGAEVDVRPRPFDDFALLHVSLRGAATIECDGCHVDVAEGRAALVAPRRDIKLRWYAGTEQLILKVPLSLMNEARGGGLNPPELAPATLISPQHGRHLELLIQCLLNASQKSTRAASEADATWLRHFEHNVALFLLTHQCPGAVTHPAPAISSPLASDASDDHTSADVRRLEAMWRYVEKRLGAPVSLIDLAAAAGVSVRTLNTLCHRHCGDTPMNLLRNKRLDAARARLLIQPSLSITDVALEHGFGHLGRFASYYVERFGELPRNTRQTPLASAPKR